ncbi:translation initiation factor [Marinomonas balearica]|uniref:Translation initiation factor 1 (eIF-1/SUI1) n=1 Tax=Marinomonas balearica TaxID=491947 RepID=A0A4R6M5Z4_9GAMM|nr:translation initiation factor [Marinomonas balearica]TDO96788.1 translation initiation factor 1 (eIF-1/SUI1) [Marinomonas balearica]
MAKKRLVFSTDQGELCPDCREPIDECNCNEGQLLGDGNIKVMLETKGRKGKGVTLISGFALTLDETKDIAKKLKASCGSGGSVKNKAIEIQGDHRDKVMEFLKKNDFKAKRVGG